MKKIFRIYIRNEILKSNLTSWALNSWLIFNEYCVIINLLSFLSLLFNPKFRINHLFRRIDSYIFTFYSLSLCGMKGKNLTNYFKLMVLSKNSIHLAYNESFIKGLAVSELLYTPANNYSVVVTHGFKSTPFSRMVTSLIYKLADNPKCARDMRSLYGMNNWQSYSRQPFYNELISIALFINKARGTPRISMTNYQTYIGQKLSVGGYRYLEFENSQSYLTFQEYQFGYVRISDKVNLDVELIKNAALNDGCNPDLFPTSDSMYISYTDTNFFSIVKEHFPAFDYACRDLTGCVEMSKYPSGYVNIYLDSNGQDVTLVLDDGKASLEKDSVAFSHLYSDLTSGDIEPAGNSIYKSYLGTINYSQYDSNYLRVYTGIVGPKQYTAYSGYIPTEPPSSPEGNPPDSEGPVDPNVPNDARRSNPRNPKSKGNRGGNPIEYIAGGIKVLADNVDPELALKTLDMALKYSNANRRPGVEVHNYPESIKEGFELTMPGGRRMNVFQHRFPKSTK